MEVKRIIITETEKKNFYSNQKNQNHPNIHHKTDEEYNKYIKNHMSSISLKKEKEDPEII